jgi:hypothetical protein
MPDSLARPRDGCVTDVDRMPAANPSGDETVTESVTAA